MSVEQQYRNSGAVAADGHLMANGIGSSGNGSGDGKGRSFENRTKSPDSESPIHTMARHLNWRLAEARDQNAFDPLEDDSQLVMEEHGDTLSVAGDVDLHQAHEFRARAEAFIRSHEQPRLDLSQVPFLDSAGLATLLALSRQAKTDGKLLRLVVTGSPRRVLKITGIDRVLVLED